jgi:pyruvate formate lyase activating enzyme
MEAYLYDKLENQKVRCNLCRHTCIIKSGRRGICGVRENHDGVLESLVDQRLIARSVDPIEKKPLFHFMPGSRSYSIAAVGCNFKCRFCQNADIAQMPGDRQGMIMGTACTPQAVVADALSQNCRSISYTYTEPTVYFEFAYETAKLARAGDIKNVFVTNGYMSAAALAMVAPYLDAANVDLKAFTETFYQNQCGAKLEPVKGTLRRMKALGILVEVTTLIIPGLNDAPQELAALAAFIVDALGPETPWHISRFHPTYRLTDRPPTPVHTLENAYAIGRKAGLQYVYMGNVPGGGGESTYCSNCRALLVDRSVFSIRHNLIQADRCPQCGTPVYGIGMSGAEPSKSPYRP